MSQVSSQNMRPQSRSSIWALMCALMVAIFAFQLNASMLSPALTTMERELNTASGQIGLTQTVFFTAAALFSLFLPRLADLAGRKRVLLGMLTVTAIGCVLSALAPNVTVLMIARVLQGTAGPIVPLCLIMLRVRVPDEKRYARLMAILTSVNGGIAGVDALLGGWLAGTFGFRSVFWTMAVVCAAAIAGVFAFADESTAEETPRMDWIGVGALSVAFVTLYLAINEIGKLGEANWVLVAIMVVLAVIFFIVFWKVEEHSDTPMVSTTYMKQRRTWGLLATTLLTMTGVFAVMNGVVPALAQDAQFGAGMGADVVSFFTLTPYAIIGLVFGPVSGILASRYGYRMVLRVGQIVTILALLLGIYVALVPSTWGLVALSVVLGASYAGTANIMLNGLGIVLSPKDNPGYLPGMNAGAFNLGAGLSYAVLYAFMQGFANSAGQTTGYVSAIIVGGVLLLAAFACSFLIPDPERIAE